VIEPYDFYEEPAEYEHYLRDSYFEEAQAEIRNLYEENKDSVFYLRQLQLAILFIGQIGIQKER
jgi:hypothetical protein